MVLFKYLGMGAKKIKFLLKDKEICEKEFNKSEQCILSYFSIFFKSIFEYKDSSVTLPDALINDTIENIKESIEDILDLFFRRKKFDSVKIPDVSMIKLIDYFGIDNLLDIFIVKTIDILRKGYALENLEYAKIVHLVNNIKMNDENLNSIVVLLGGDIHEASFMNEFKRIFLSGEHINFDIFTEKFHFCQDILFFDIREYGFDAENIKNRFNNETENLFDGYDLFGHFLNGPYIFELATNRKRNYKEFTLNFFGESFYDDEHSINLRVNNHYENMDIVNAPNNTEIYHEPFDANNSRIDDLPINEDYLSINEDDLPINDLPINEDDLPINEDYLSINEDDLPINEGNLPINEDNFSNYVDDDLSMFHSIHSIEDNFPINVVDFAPKYVTMKRNDDQFKVYPTQNIYYSDALHDRQNSFHDRQNSFRKMKNLLIFLKKKCEIYYDFSGVCIYIPKLSMIMKLEKYRDLNIFFGNQHEASRRIIFNNYSVYATFDCLYAMDKNVEIKLNAEKDKSYEYIYKEWGIEVKKIINPTKTRSPNDPHFCEQYGISTNYMIIDYLKKGVVPSHVDKVTDDNIDYICSHVRMSPNKNNVYVIGSGMFFNQFGTFKLLKMKCPVFIKHDFMRRKIENRLFPQTRKIIENDFDIIPTQKEIDIIKKQVTNMNYVGFNYNFPNNYFIESIKYISSYFDGFLGPRGIKNYPIIFSGETYEDFHNLLLLEEKHGILYMATIIPQINKPTQNNGMLEYPKIVFSAHFSRFDNGKKNVHDQKFDINYLMMAPFNISVY
jgi:hypothetical protein